MGFFDFLSNKIDDAELEKVGIQLQEKIYFKELAIFIAKSYIANTLSKCEIKTYKGGEEVREELYYMLNYSPNPNQSSSQLMNQLISSYYDDGHALVVPVKNAIYVADGFQIDQKPLKDDVFCNVSVENQQISKKFKASEVFYFKLDDQRVRSLVDGLYSDYGNLISIAIGAFKKANSEKYKLVLENTQAGDPAFAKTFNEVIKKQLDAFINSDKAVYPQFRGQSLEPMRVDGSTTSADVIALRKEIFETVAQAYKIPMSMMYGNITNMNEIVKVYLSICIDPLARMISEELTRKTETYESWKRGNFVKVDTSKVNHMSILEAADKMDKAIASGVASIDDMRGFFDMNPLSTDYSEAHFMTRNYLPVEDMLYDLERSSDGEQQQ